jgi:hypothetical protein
MIEVPVEDKKAKPPMFHLLMPTMDWEGTTHIRIPRVRELGCGNECDRCMNHLSAFISLRITCRECLDLIDHYAKVYESLPTGVNAFKKDQRRLFKPRVYIELGRDEKLYRECMATLAHNEYRR